MSKQTIEAIRAAEAKADTIRADAVKKAANMQEQAEADGKRLCDDTERETARKFKELMSEVQTKAEQLRQKSDEETMKEADLLRTSANQKKRAAVKYIVRGITD